MSLSESVRRIGAKPLFISEEICRAFFESLFGQPFPKTRPEWLRAPSGRRLELDGFCEPLGMAFEHHGQQHYQRGRFSSTESELSKRLDYDSAKRAGCEERGILLIEIPELDRFLPVSDLRAFIKGKVQEAGRQVPDDFDTRSIDDTGVRLHGGLSRLRSAAEARGGVCLSKSWLGIRRRHHFRCADGHVWSAVAYEVLVGNTWCPHCYRRDRGALVLRRDIEAKFGRLRQVADSRGGACLSSEWLGAAVGHRFRCAFGHEWEARPHNVLRGTWCPKCARGGAG